MSSFINNVSDFCKGFESVLPVGKVSKFVAVKAIDIVANQAINSMSTPKHDFGGYTASVDRDGYAEVRGHRIYEIN